MKAITNKLWYISDLTFFFKYDKTAVLYKSSVCTFDTGTRCLVEVFIFVVENQGSEVLGKFPVSGLAS